MPTTIKGHVPCPECQSTQEVKHDGRKYFISCTECKTFTNYQSKIAKARIEGRLTPVDKPERRPPTPAKASGGFLESLNELFSE